MADIRVGNSTYAVSGTNGDDTFMPDRWDQWLIPGSHVLSGGLGNDVYRVESNTTVVIEKPGEGVDGVQATGNYKMPDNIEILWFGGNSAFGNDQDNYMQGGGNSTLIDGGRGNDQIEGGGGADIYQFSADSGHDTLLSWNNANKIRLTGYDKFHSLSDVTSAMAQVGNDVLLKLDAQNDVTIKNVHISDFTNSNFQYHFTPDKLHLSFDDEFNSFSSRATRGAATGIWSTELGDGRGPDSLNSRTLGANDEKQIYVDPGFKGAGGEALGLNPFSVDNGVLSIHAQAAPAADKAALYNYDYTSGYISTRETFAQTYGYFEARMQLPADKGSWPAFWLFRKDGVWPPELDIMEAWNDTTAVQTVHTQENGYHQMTSGVTWLPDGDTSFHDYGFLWTADKLTWYLDGVEVFSQPTPADMNSPMYMILNLAISNQVDNPNFDETLKVDYVRAYSLEELPAGIAPVSSDPTLPTTSSGSHAYFGAVEGMPDGLNSAYYLSHNPDVAAVYGNDAVSHYLNHGKAEGRSPYDSSDTTDHGSGGTITPSPVPDTPVISPVITSPVPVVDTSVTPTPATNGSTGDHGYWGAVTNAQDGFNAKYYATHNPDVVAVFGTDEGYLLYHYETYGKKEGRLAYDGAGSVTMPTPTPATPDPVPNTPITPTPLPDIPTSDHAYWGRMSTAQDGFNASYYATHNPDVVAVFGTDEGNLLYHYETYGKKEGRLAFDTTDVQSEIYHAYWGAVTSAQDGFNAEYYASHNPDVVAVFGTDKNYLLYHYETYGKAEGRLAYESTQTSLKAAVTVPSISPDGGATSSAISVVADLHDLSSSSFHTDMHSFEPVILLGVTSTDQHYGLAA